MSKGTKQIRLGRVEKMLKELEARLVTLQEVEETNEKYSRFTGGQIYELEKTLKTIKEEFGL